MTDVLEEWAEEAFSPEKFNKGETTLGKNKEEYFISLTHGVLGQRYKIEYKDTFGKDQVTYIPRKQTKEFCALLSGQNYLQCGKTVFLYDTFHIIVEDANKVCPKSHYRITGYSDSVPLKYSVKNVNYGTEQSKSLYNLLHGRR